MFVPNAIYYEKNITDYPLGRTLLDQYASIPKIIIEKSKFGVSKNETKFNYWRS